MSSACCCTADTTPELDGRSGVRDCQDSLPPAACFGPFTQAGCLARAHGAAEWRHRIHVSAREGAIMPRQTLQYAFFASGDRTDAARLSGLFRISPLACHAVRPPETSKTPRRFESVRHGPGRDENPIPQTRTVGKRKAPEPRRRPAWLGRPTRAAESPRRRRSTASSRCCSTGGRPARGLPRARTASWPSRSSWSCTRCCA